MADTPAPTPMRPDTFIDKLLVISLVFWVTLAIVILAFVQIPDKNMPIFSGVVMAGVFGTLGTLIGYRWGNSRGSDQKTDTISAIATKAVQ